MGLHMMKIWTFFEKEDQVEEMNLPRTLGEQVENMKLPRKWGVIMRLTLMMDDSDEGLTLCMQSIFALQTILLYGEYA